MSRKSKKGAKRPNKGKVVSELLPFAVYIEKFEDKKKSIMSVANKLKEKYSLPEDRQPILLFDNNSDPSRNNQLPIIKQQLVKDIKKKDEIYRISLK